MATEKLANFVQTTLSSPITLGATAITVTDGSKMPSSGNFRLNIGGEIVLVTARSGNNLTVVRGQESTTAVAHDVTDNVSLVLSAGSLNQLFADNITADVAANRPASERAGKLYFATDAPVVFRDNGTTWDAWGPVYSLTPPPSVSSLNWVNQGTATAVDQNGGIYMTAPALAGHNIRMLVESAPSAPYNFTVGFLPLLYPTASANAGVIFRDSSSGKLNRWITYYSGGNLKLYAGYHTDPQTPAGSFVDTPVPLGMNNIIWLRIRDDGTTNRIYSYSVDGNNFLTMYTESRTNNFTANQIGITTESQQASGPASALFVSYKKS